MEIWNFRLSTRDQLERAAGVKSATISRCWCVVVDWVCAWCNYFSQDVQHQAYVIRYHFSSAPGLLRQALRHYNGIAHKSAMDNYVIGNPSLHIHTPDCVWTFRYGQLCHRQSFAAQPHASLHLNLDSSPPVQELKKIICLSQELELLAVDDSPVSKLEAFRALMASKPGFYRFSTGKARSAQCDGKLGPIVNSVPLKSIRTSCVTLQLIDRLFELFHTGSIPLNHVKNRFTIVSCWKWVAAAIDERTSSASDSKCSWCIQHGADIQKWTWTMCKLFRRFNALHSAVWSQILR